MTTIVEFRNKWGVLTPHLLVEKFIRDAPNFPGEKELAKVIGELMADLQSVLENVKG